MVNINIPVVFRCNHTIFTIHRWRDVHTFVWKNSLVSFRFFLLRSNPISYRFKLDINIHHKSIFITDQNRLVFSSSSSHNVHLFQLLSEWWFITFHTERMDEKKKKMGKNLKINKHIQSNTIDDIHRNHFASTWETRVKQFFNGRNGWGFVVNGMGGERERNRKKRSDQLRWILICIEVIIKFQKNILASNVWTFEHWTGGFGISFNRKNFWCKNKFKTKRKWMKEWLVVSRREWKELAQHSTV